MVICLSNTPPLASFILNLRGWFESVLMISITLPRLHSSLGVSPSANSTNWFSFGPFFNEVFHFDLLNSVVRYSLFHLDQNRSKRCRTALHPSPRTVRVSVDGGRIIVAELVKLYGKIKCDGGVALLIRVGFTC